MTNGNTISIPNILLQLLNAVKDLCKADRHKQVAEKLAESIISLENMIQTNNTKYYYKTVSPIHDAMLCDPKHFQQTVLNGFYMIFNQSSPNDYPTRQLAHFMITVITLADFEYEKSSLLMAQICFSCLNTVSGALYIHGPNLRIVFEILMKSFSCTSNEDIRKKISSMIEDLIILLFNRFSEPPMLPQIEETAEFAKQYTNMLIANTMMIRAFCVNQITNGEYSLTISHVDLCVIISLFCRIVENFDFGIYAMSLAANYLAFILNLKSDFFQTQIFKNLLKKYFPPAIAFCLFHRHKLFTKPGIELALLIYRNFAPDFGEQFQVIFMRGLYTLLSSPNGLAQNKSLTIISVLIEETHFFPDICFNFDCNFYYQNVYQTIFTNICQRSFPNQSHSKNYMNIIGKLLKSIWIYLSETSQNGTNKYKIEYNVALGRGIEIFQRSAERSLKFLTDNKIIENTPEAISLFLYKCEKLDRSQIAMFLTESTNFEYLNFFMQKYNLSHAKTFDEALRIFISHLDLPKVEARIGILLNEFGKLYLRFFKQTEFSSAEAVVTFARRVLAYQGGADQPKIEQFIVANKGINNGADLPIEFLKEIYSSIVSAPIVLTPKPEGKKNKKQLVNWYISHCNQQLFLAKIIKYEGKARFSRCNSAAIVKPMIELIWGSIHGSIVANIEASNTDTEEYVGILQLCIKIAARSGTVEPLKILTSSLSTFTGLRTIKNNKMTPKGAMCFKSLLEIAKSEANYLLHAWPIIFEQMSFFDKQIQTESNELIDIVDTFIASTNTFSMNSLMALISASCDLSKTELNENPSRYYMLDKLILIAQYNMSRPNEQWKDIWRVIGDYLCTVASSSKIPLSIIGTNHLKFIAAKFLLRAEKPSENYQEQFMFSFLNTFQDQAIDKSRLYLLESLDQLIKEASPNIKSGWIMVFQILTIATAEPITQNVAFRILTQVVGNELVVGSPQYVIHLISFIASFTKNTNSFAAIPFYDKIVKSINDKKSWFAIFESIERCSQCSKTDVKLASQESYFRSIIELTSRLNDSDIWEYAVVKTLKKFSFVEHDQFLIKFNDIFIQKYISKLGDNIKHIISYLIYAVFNCDEKTALISIKILESITSLSINEETKTYIILLFDNSIEEVYKLSLESVRKYISLLQNFAKTFMLKAKFVQLFSLLSLSAQKCQNADAMKRNVICALARNSILTEIEDCDELNTVDKATEINVTLQLFLQSGFIQNSENEAFIEWNRTICETLEFVNKFEDGTEFSQYFDIIVESLLSMLSSSSKETRKHLGSVIQRKLLALL